jgi:receptor expression-enhancing protein 1/2/3/4
MTFWLIFILFVQVKWMMYLIVFALFSVTECVLDPLLSFWLPFYSEVKVVLLVYPASPVTRGSGVVYRTWVHPLLCSNEEEIDKVLEKVKEQGYNTAKAWIQKGVQWLGGMLVTTAINVSL